MTSIEFFAEQIGVLYTQFSNGFISLNDFKIAFNSEYKQAKEMHKQEIVNAVENGNYGNGEHYYNETFKKD